MKKSIIWAMLAMLLPITQAWAWGGGHSKHTGTISVQSTGNGTVYVASSSTATSGSSSGSVDCGSNESGDNNTKDYWLFATADAGYHFKGWSESSGGSIVSEDNPLKYTIKVNNNATRYASFEKNPAVSVSFETPVNGSYTITVGGETKPDYSALETSDEMTLTATPANGYRVYGWYTVSGGTRTYFAYGATAKYVAMSATTIGVDFISESEVAKVSDLAELTAALAGSAKVAEIAAGTKILVPSGTTLTIPAGKKVTTCSKQVANSDGTTSTSYGYLAVAGTLKVEGVVDGTGKVLKVVKDVTQSAPITPKAAAGEITSFQFSNYGKFKCTYCKTTVTSVTPTVTGTPSCTVSWGVTLNGATPYAISAQDPYALNVSFPVDGSGHSTIGVPNQIQSINGCQTSSSTSADSGHFLLLKDWKIDNKVYQGVVDCAGKKLTFGNSDDYHKRVMCFNGQFDHNSGTFKNGCVACINCSYAQIVSCKNEPMFYFFDMGTAESPATVKITYYSGNNAASGSIKHAYFYSGYINYSFSANNDKDVGKSYVYGGSFNNDPTDKSIIEPGYEIDSSSGRYVLVKAVAKPDVVNIGTTAYKSLQEAVDAAASGARLELIQALELDGEVKIASGKQLTIDLAGYDLSGGSIVNEGKLRFEDTNASTAKRTMSTPVTNKGSGTIDITFGDYSGTFTLNGGTLTTHNGTFASTFSVVENGGTWTMKGGKYSCPITIPEGYRVYDNGYFGEIVKGLINPNNPISSSSADFSYTIKALDDADSLALYTKYMHGTTARDKYDDADWDRIAELRSCVGYLADTKYIEAAVVFDRPVKKDTFYGVVKMSSSTKSMAFGDLAAGEECRMLIPMILANNYTPKGYDYMFDGHENGVWETLYCGGRNTSLDNIGTTVTLFFQVRTQTRSADYTTENQHHDYLPYMDLAVYPKKLTGKGAIAGETDYASLSGALSAAKYSGTVRLSKDCSEAIVVNKATTFTIDTNNFVFSGSVAAGDGLKVVASDLGDGKTRYSVVAVERKVTVLAPENGEVVSVLANGVTPETDDDGDYLVTNGMTVVVAYSFGGAKGYELLPTSVVVTADMAIAVPAPTPIAYAITYNDGYVNSNPATYTIEDEVTLEAPTREDYDFLGWYTGTWQNEKVEGVAIKAGSTGEKTFTARWKHVPVRISVPAVPNATVRVTLPNGEVKPNEQGEYWFAYGSKVTITYTADEGYQLKGASTVVLDANGVATVETAPTTEADEYAIEYKLYDGEYAAGYDITNAYTVATADLVIPAPTKAGCDFGGWYEDALFTKKCGEVTIPSGSTGDKTLYASWLSKVATVVEAKDDEGQDAEVSVVVPENWVTNAVGAEATEEQVREKLQETADNGLKNWQNFALDAAGVTDAGTTVTVEKKEEPASASDVTVTIKTAESVKKVAVVQVESITNATVTALVEEKDIAEVAAEDGKKEAEIAVNYAELEEGIYRPAVVVEDVNKVKTMIPDVSVPAVQVVKDDKKSSTTVLAVPFNKGLDGEKLTIASVIDTSSLADGDTIKKYNNASGNYDMWTYSNGTWQAEQTFSSTAGLTQPVAADELELEAGQALIVERSGEATNNVLTMVGQYAEDVVTPIEQPVATAENPTPDPVWNLVGNADAGKEFDVAKIEAANRGDEIVVPSSVGGLPKRFHKNVDGDWCYTTNVVRMVTVRGRESKVVKTVEVTDDTKISKGGWFWYVSGGGDKKTEIDWKKK